MVQVTVVASQVSEGGGALPLRSGGSSLAGLAVLTLTPSGHIASWSVTAARFFGFSAERVVGRDVCDVLLTRPDQREVMNQALAEVAAGRIWTGTVPVSAASGSYQVTVHCEPLGRPGGDALLIARRALPEPGSGRTLPEVATRIGTTLDLNRTAREAADVAVPAFADGVTIFVSERLLAADELGPHPSGPAVVRRLVTRLAGEPASVTDSLLRPGEVLVFGTDSPSFRAMTARCPVLFDELDPESAERIALRPGGAEIAKAFTSFLAVPLVARGTVLGSATFARSAARDEFTPADISLADQLASRAAVSIDNARLYDRERRTASALQQGLLPSEPTVPDGLAVAHRYLPVGASIVGGDWHDIVPLTSGRAVLIVGDAMGHGPEAAAVMVQLRTAAHTLADLELPPEEILSRLDRMATGMTTAPFATCIAAVIDPAAGSCEIAKAGHLPPMLTLANGETSILDLPIGLPIGLGSGTFEAAKIALPAGATLALYTDGLVESRIRPLDDGLIALSEALGAALTRPGYTLDLSCQQISHALRQRGEDDMTLVLARVVGTNE
jgi:serine phosphatase RsbU (regulator of sigma subunit)